MENQNEEKSVVETFLEKKKREVRICEKPTITVYEAAAYTGIGINKLRRIADTPGANLVICVGTKRMFKRKKLEEYLESHFSI